MTAVPSGHPDPDTAREAAARSVERRAAERALAADPSRTGAAGGLARALLAALDREASLTAERDALAAQIQRVRELLEDVHAALDPED